MKPGNCCSRGVQKVARTLQDLLTIPTPQIVVTENDNGRVGQVRSKHPFNGAVEMIAINQTEHGQARVERRSNVHGRARCSSPPPISPVRLPP